MLSETFKDEIESSLIALSPFTINGVSYNVGVNRAQDTIPAEVITGIVTRWGNARQTAPFPSEGIYIESDVLLDQHQSYTDPNGYVVVYDATYAEFTFTPEYYLLSQIQVYMEIPTGSTSGIEVEIYQEGQLKSTQRMYYFEFDPGAAYHTIWAGRVKVRPGVAVTVKIKEYPYNDDSTGVKVYHDNSGTVQFKQYYRSQLKLLSAGVWVQSLTVRVVSKHDDRRSDADIYNWGYRIRDTIMDTILTEIQNWVNGLTEAKADPVGQVITNDMILPSAEGGKYWAEVVVQFNYIRIVCSTEAELEFKTINIRDIRLL